MGNNEESKNQASAPGARKKTRMLVNPRPQGAEEGYQIQKDIYSRIGLISRAGEVIICVV